MGKKVGSKIINKEKAMEMVKKVEEVFDKDELTMIDKEYVINQLQRAIEIYYKDVGEKAMINFNFDNLMEKFKDTQLKKDL
jgi:hypothetical protein